jgi:hypothetical protein
MRHTALVLLALVITQPAVAAEPTPAAVQQLIDERAIITIADGIDRAVDAKDWPKARSYFADRVRVDFSSLTGQPAATMPSEDLIGAWSGNLRGTKTSLHLRTNHAVTFAADRATVISNGYAWNRMEGNGDPLWEVWGIYEYSLVKTSDTWKVESFTFRATHQRGNNWVRDTPGR